LFPSKHELRTDFKMKYVITCSWKIFCGLHIFSVGTFGNLCRMTESRVPNVDRKSKNATES
jgi:hypothetical protein